MKNRAFRSLMRRFLWLVVALPFVIPAQTVQADDLMDLYRLALENDPQFLGSEYVHQASRETLKQAYSDLFPVLSVDADYTETVQDIRERDDPIFGIGKSRFDTKYYTLTLTQPVFVLPTFVRLRQAKAEIKRSDVEYENARQELILRVATVYLQALAAQDEVDFAETELTAVKRQFELANERLIMGLAPITDFHDAKARLASVEARKIEAKNTLDDTLQALKEVCGTVLEDLATLKEQLPLVSPDPHDVELWINAALKENLELKIREHTAEVARQEVKRQRSAHYPTLNLVGRANLEDTDGTVFGGGREVETTDLLVRLTLPLYQGGSVSSRTREAVQLYQKSLQDLEQQKRAVIRQTRAAHSGIYGAISKVDALKQGVVSQRSALEAKQEGFKSGLFTALAVLDAERDLHLARRDYAKARYEYILNTLLLKQAVGTLAEADIRVVNDWFQ